ncbi:MAG: RNA polymerase sigma factor, partial [Terriglobia bacterium]
MEVQGPAAERNQPEFFHALAEDRAVLDPERQLRAKEIDNRLREALESLSPRERIVFELRHYEGLRLRAISERVGASENTVKNCLFRATHKLRAKLADLI